MWKHMFRDWKRSLEHLFIQQILGCLSSAWHPCWVCRYNRKLFQSLHSKKVLLLQLTLSSCHFWFHDFSYLHLMLLFTFVSSFLTKKLVWTYYFCFVLVIFKQITEIYVFLGFCLIGRFSEMHLIILNGVISYSSLRPGKIHVFIKLWSSEYL